MQTYYARFPTIEAVQLTDAIFDDPHPNPDHVVGVLYDPMKRCAFLWSDGDHAYNGRVELGEWIIRRSDGTLTVLDHFTFSTFFKSERD